MLLATAGIAVSAQTNSVKFGIRAGATFPTMSFSEDSEGTVKMKTSIYAGATADFSLGNKFSIQPGLTILGKGTKLKINGTVDLADDEADFDGTGTVHLLYLEVPVNFIANFQLGNGKAFIGAGPYYAMGINGEQKIKATIGYGGQTESDSSYEDVKFGDNEDFKRHDMGLNFIAGYELSTGINIQAGYGLGLSNIVNDNDLKVKNRVLSVGLGYTF